MRTNNLQRPTYNLNIAWLYPDLMSTYGDRGNVFCLQKRGEWRGIPVKIIPVSLETQNSVLSTCDLIFMGGAQDRQQKLANDDLRKNKGSIIKEMIERNIPALFVCAAYQFVGQFYKTADGTKLSGLKILDLYTINPGTNVPRCIGNVVAEVLMLDFSPSARNDKTIVGFENHGGRTYLGKTVRPLARVLKGFGNNGEDGYEGALYKNVIGSYFHGPILPKNSHLADYLLAKALEVKYNKQIRLPKLDDTLEWEAHRFLLKRLGL